MSQYQRLGSSRLRWYTSALLFTSISTALAPVALAFGVIELGGSAGDLGLVLAARTAPQLLLLLVGGVVADRFPRHVILVLCGLLGIATHTAAGLIIVTGAGTLWELAALETANGAAAAFSYPALAGMLPELVSKPAMARASSITGLARYAGAVLGGLSGGLFAAFGSAGYGLLAAALAILTGTLLLFPLTRTPRPASPSGGPSGAAPAAGVGKPAGSRGLAHLCRELAEGWRTFIGTRWLWTVVSGFCIINMVSAGVWMTLGPVIATGSLGEAGWGIVIALFSAGTALGTLSLLRFQPRFLLRAGVAAVALEVPALVALAFPSLPIVTPLAMLAGTGIGYFSAAWRATLAREVPADRLSRVASIDGLGSFIAVPVGQIVASQLHDRIGSQSVILLGATLTTTAIAAMLATPSVRHLATPEQSPSGTHPPSQTTTPHSATP